MTKVEENIKFAQFQNTLYSLIGDRQGLPQLLSSRPMNEKAGQPQMDRKKITKAELLSILSEALLISSQVDELINDSQCRDSLRS